MEGTKLGLVVNGIAIIIEEFVKCCHGMMHSYSIWWVRKSSSNLLVEKILESYETGNLSFSNKVNAFSYCQRGTCQKNVQKTASTLRSYEFRVSKKDVGLNKTWPSNVRFLESPMGGIWQSLLFFHYILISKNSVINIRPLVVGSRVELESLQLMVPRIS